MASRINADLHPACCFIAILPSQFLQVFCFRRRRGIRSRPPVALHVLTNDRFQFPLDESLWKVEVMRLDEAFHDGVLVGIFDFLLERLFHLRPQALLKFGQRGVGAAIFGKLVVQVWKLLDLDGVMLTVKVTVLPATRESGWLAG